MRSPPQLPSRKLDGVYRVFSAPDGVETEAEVAAVEAGRAALQRSAVRDEVRRYLLELRDRIARDPDRWTRAAVVMQVSLEAGHRPSVLVGEVGAPPTTPRRSQHELVALALEDLDG